MTILGETAFIDASTSFDDRISPTNIEGLSVGDIVASRIEPKPAGTEFEVHGKVAVLDTGGSSFNLSQLNVDCGTAILDDFNGATIAKVILGITVETDGGTIYNFIRE